MLREYFSSLRPPFSSIHLAFISSTPFAPRNMQVLLQFHFTSLDMKVGEAKGKKKSRKMKTSASSVSAPFQHFWCRLTLRSVRGNDLSLQQGLRRGRLPLPRGRDYEFCLPLPCQLPKITQWEQPSSLSLKACKSKP